MRHKRSIATAASFLTFALTLTLHANAASASTIHAVAVTSSSGGFSAPLSRTIGAANGTFVQFGEGSSVVLDFGSASTVSTLLDIFTFDDVLPAFARLEVSIDNSVFNLVAANFSDANGVVEAGVYPSAQFPVASLYRYVRITDLGLLALYQGIARQRLAERNS